MLVLVSKISKKIPLFFHFVSSAGACKHALKRQNSESFCNLLKDHYLECFLEKDGDHVKAVKIKSAMEPGQMYWCKTCILIFEKPWSLFQHMADKAKGSKVQRWDKKIHLDWLDTVAGLLAGKCLLVFPELMFRILDHSFILLYFDSLNLLFSKSVDNLHSLTID